MKYAEIYQAALGCRHAIQLTQAKERIKRRERMINQHNALLRRMEAVQTNNLSVNMKFTDARNERLRVIDFLTTRIPAMGQMAQQKM